MNEDGVPRKRARGGSRNEARGMIDRRAMMRMKAFKRCSS